jgi:hypothetical protein
MDGGPALSCRLLWRIHRQLAATRKAEEVYCQRFVLNKTKQIAVAQSSEPRTSMDRSKAAVLNNKKERKL